jgi:gamma-glutamylcyclotransferase (GGCT)/AIG2-like uncharacterized protein YtfP
LLFVYGTLRRDLRAPAWDRLRPLGRFFDYGVIGARMFDVGGYPGIIFCDGARVHGEVFALTAPAVALAQLDAYEGVEGGPQPWAAQYRRETATVATRRHGSIATWAYVFIRPHDHYPAIAGGDYVRYCRAPLPASPPE